MKIVDQLIAVLGFTRLNYHGLARKKLKSTVAGMGLYVIHINGVFEQVYNESLGFESLEENPDKVAVCLQANLSDDYFEEVEVFQTDNIDDVIALINAIAKDPWHLVKLFEEHAETSFIIPTMIL